MNKQYLLTLFLAIFCITAQAQDTAKKIKEVTVSERIQVQNKTSQNTVNSAKNSKEARELEKIVAKEEKAINQMKVLFETRKDKLSSTDKETFKSSLAKAEKKLVADKEKLKKLQNTQ